MEQLERIASRSEPLSRTSLVAREMFVETQKKRVQRSAMSMILEEVLHHAIELLSREERRDGDRRIVERET